MPTRLEVVFIFSFDNINYQAVTARPRTSSLFILLYVSRESRNYGYGNYETMVIRHSAIEERVNPGGGPGLRYERVEDARRLAKGYKSRILVSLRVLSTKHHFFLSLKISLTMHSKK